MEWYFILIYRRLIKVIAIVRQVARAILPLFFLLPSNSIRLLSEKLAKAFSVVVEMGRR